MMSGAYDKALADYETAHLDVPDDVHCLYEGSLAAEKLGKLSKSVQICTELIKLSPNTSDFYLRRGDLESREKQFSQAESDYSKGIRIDPTDAVAYESRAELCLTHGDYAQAAKDFTAAMDVAPDSKPLILAKRAVAYDKMNRPDLAARDRKDSSATTKVKAAGTGG
jgi:tetratricopeptide (TPR) repeat protein